MKQLSALGARRHFFRNPRRMRALRAGMSPSELDEEMMGGGPGFGYFSGKYFNQLYPVFFLFVYCYFLSYMLCVSEA